MADLKKQILVIGGGTAGLSTALGLADGGIPVTLVERSGKLGGHAAEWACMATTDCAKCNACVVHDLMKKTNHHPGITVMTNTELVDLAGSPGAFKASVKPVVKNGNGAAETKLDAQAVVVTTGFTPYDAKEDPMLGYGSFPGVITTKDLDDVLVRDSIGELIPEDLETPRIGFIQCVGSRDVKRHREYCSQFCCKTSVRLARRLKYLAPNASITIFYIDLQIMGKEFKKFYEESKGMIEFVQGTPAEVTPLGLDGPYRVYAYEPETGKTVARELDKVVLAIGVDHRQDNDKLANLLGLEVDEMGFFLTLGTHSPAPGIYVAGACAGPADMRTSITNSLATVAAIKKDLRKSGDETPAPQATLHQFV